MSWLTKVCFFTAMCLTTVVANAQRFTFDGGADKARVETRVLSDRHDIGSVLLHLSVPRLDVDAAEDGYKKVAAPGLVPLDEAGKPELFTTGSLIVVPAGYEADLNIERVEATEIPDVVVRPAQKKYRCDCAENQQFAFDSALYINHSEPLFPANNIRLESAGSLGDLKLMRVAFYPLQMEMKKHALKVTTDATLRISFRRTHAAPATRLNNVQWDLIRNATANGREIGSHLVRTDSREGMLIVAADTFAPSLTRLVEWKRARGLKVDVATFTEAGGTKEKVKDFVANYYAKADVKPSYLLFVGNKTTLPAYSTSTGSGNAYSDYTYALLGGNNVPNVAYGRLVADNVDELNTQIDRWIAYEKSPQSGAEWYANGTTIASDEGSNMSDKEYAQTIAKSLKDHTYKTVDGFYQDESSATVANISGAVNQGRTWLAYFGHGSGTSWGSTNEDYDVETIGKLENDDKLPFIIDVACQNASWVSIPKSFGKAWVTQQHNGHPAGAVAFLGGSVNISWHPPAIMSVGIAKYHFEKPVHSLGASVLAGQLYLIEQKGNNPETIDNVKWYNLLGDPSLTMRTATPKAYDLKQSIRKEGRDVFIDVTAMDQDGKGVSGVLTAIHASSTEALATGTTDAEGKVTLSVAGVGQLAPNTVLTATGYNLETHEIAIQ
jgi:hypothetical protein